MSFVGEAHPMAGLLQNYYEMQQMGAVRRLDEYGRGGLAPCLTI